MKKEDKNVIIDELAEKLANNPIFYLADTSELSVEVVNNLRRACFKSNVSMTVVKNKLLRKAMEKVEDKDFSGLYDVLAGPTSIMFSEVANVPAKTIQSFRKKHDKPVLKAAFIEDALFIGDNQLQALADLKSKEELIGDIIMILQSPAKNVVSALSSGKHKIAGLVKTLSERA
jgi:large subunit ribosomal protein L10